MQQHYKITIIGLGLIGGSLGMALRKASAAGKERLQVTGFARSSDVRSKAVKLGAVDKAVDDVRVAVRDADIVVIATDIIAIKDVMSQIAEELPKGCVVTDVASTKTDVMAWASELLPERVNFVGGHPMAGKETTGISSADADLFRGAAYCVVPSLGASEEAVRSIVAMAELAGARAVFMDAHEHDSYVGGISHLPLVASVALFTLVSGSSAWPEMAALSGGGFRDTTRLASGEPDMSFDICASNKDNVIHWLDRYVEELRRLRGLIESGDEELFKVFAKAQIDRMKFLRNPSGLREEMEKEQGTAIEMPNVADMLFGTWGNQRIREWMNASEERMRRLEQQPRRHRE